MPSSSCDQHLCFIVDLGIGRHAFGQPHIAANDTAGANHGIAPKDRGTGIDHYVILNGWVAFYFSVLFSDTQPTKGHALIDLDV